MKNMLVKDTVKEIKKSLGRFLSIFAITALGVSFFAGIKVAPVFMRNSLDKYYDSQDFMDFTILSTLGLTEDDIKYIKETTGVSNVTPSKSMDVIINFDNKDMVVKALGVPQNVFNGTNNEYVNKPLLIEGRMPENPNECLVEKEKMEELNIPLGTKLKVSSGTDTDINESLSVNEYTVVGYAQTPNFLSFEKGKSNIGKGDINNFIMIFDENFKNDIYTEAYVTAKGAKELNTFDEKYFEYLKPTESSLEALGKERSSIRYDEVIGEAKKKLKESEDELNKAKEEANKGFEEGRNKLEDSKRAIEKGEKELKVNREKINETFRQGELKLAEAEGKLEAGEEQYKQAEDLFNEVKQNILPYKEKAEGDKKKLEDEKLSYQKEI
ncbi:MAG: ABC transporter permease, partial [Clostridium sp.]